MFEKIKTYLLSSRAAKQIRLACVALLTSATIMVVALLGNSIYTINIFDGETTYTVRSLTNNIASVLTNANLKSDSFRVLDTRVSGMSTSINIVYTFPVHITRGSETVTVDFSGGTVAEAIAAAGWKVDEFDFVQPSADTVISQTAYIDYTDISYVNGSWTEDIPYTTETIYSSETDRGVTKVVSGGINGLKEVHYTEKFVNGVAAEKTVTGTTVIAAAVNAQTIVGTKPAKGVGTSSDIKAISWLTPDFPIELDANGNPVNYSSKMTVRATAYTYTGYNCSTGVPPQPGYIAVNPKVIPYGTKLYIKSPDGRIVYGYAVAADTGGFIKKYPTGIDLFMATRSQCINFGVRNMEVYILE